MEQPHVVIVGAGFGGLAAAAALRRLPVRVTVVDQVNYHTFQPLLYQVATAALEPDSVANNVRAILRRHGNASFRLAQVRSVDWEVSELELLSADRSAATLGFDYLILAAGAITNTFRVPGGEDNTFPLKTLDDAVRLRNHILRQFELADSVAVTDDGGLTFLVAGGGPTGVELSGALVELLQHVLVKDFPALELRRARVILVEALDRLLSEFRPVLGREARAILVQRGVEVKLGARVEKVDSDRVLLSNGEVIPTRTVIWAVGVHAAPLANTLGLPQTEAGRLVVSPDLSLPGHPHAFAVGDVAAGQDVRGLLLAQTAPVAIQEANHVAREIERRLRSLPALPFAYHDKGTMATIGRNAAVVQFPGGAHFSGFPAWVLWLLLHLVRIVGFRNRAVVLLNSFWNYVTYDRGSRLIQCQCLETREPHL